MAGIEAGQPARAFIPDEPAEDDALDFKPYVEGLANVIAAPGTRTPLTMGLLGSWGSGKTSLMEQLRAELKRRGFNQPRGNRMLWINVWELSPRGDLGRSFLQAVLIQSRRELTLAARIRFSMYLLRRRLDARVLIGQAAANSYRLLLVALPTVFATRTAVSTSGLVDPVTGELASLVLAFWLLIKPLFEGTKDRLSLDLDRLLRKEPYELQISVLQRLHEDFNKLITLWVGDTGRLVIFVDDLDRCPPQRIPDLFEAIKLFMTSRRCVYVLAGDRDIIARSIQARLQTTPVTAVVDGDAMEGRRYLEKVLQLPFELPPVDTDTIRRYIDSFNVDWPANETRCREVFAVGLPRNPRRIKRAVNVFLLLWELAERRRATIGKAMTPLRLAKIVGLQLEYVAVFEQLREEPTRLVALEAACQGRPHDALPASVEASASVSGIRDMFCLPQAANAGADGGRSDPDNAHFAGLGQIELEALFSLTARVASVQPTPALEIEELIRRYEEVRASQPASDARTATMTGIVTEMIKRAESMRSFDARQALRSDEGGRRLAGYAFLYAHPDGDLVEDLVGAVTAPEPQPFAQYWGLQTIDRLVATRTVQDDQLEMIERELKALAGVLGPKVDRYQVVQRILENIRRITTKEQV